MMPKDPVLPRALMEMLKFDCGSLPVPRLWNGPPKLNAIGLVIVLEPDGTSVRLKFRLPLLTLCEPLKVCLSRLLASLELPPHALRAAAVAATTSRVISPLIR